MFRQYTLKNYRFRLIVYVVILSIIGVNVIESAAGTGTRANQVQGLIIGLVVMGVVSIIDYKIYLRYMNIIYIAAVVLLALVVFSPLAASSGGATRWISIGSVQFQPSELAKVMLIVFFAGLFVKIIDRLNRWYWIIGALALILIPMVLVQMEPDLSTTITLLLIFLVMWFVAGLSYRIIAWALAVLVPLCVVGLILMSQGSVPFIKQYQYIRILAWMYPDEYPDYSRQQTNAEIAIGSGQLTGKGLNNNSVVSLKNGDYISEPQTDFIFTIVAEELGFAGCLLVIILLILIILECILIAYGAKDLGGRIICSGVAGWIGFQSIVNMCVNTGLIPNTGLPLPFVSYGQSSIICLCIGIGLVLNVGMQMPAHRTKGDLHT